MRIYLSILLLIGLVWAQKIDTNTGIFLVFMVIVLCSFFGVFVVYVVREPESDKPKSSEIDKLSTHQKQKPKEKKQIFCNALAFKE